MDSFEDLDSDSDNNAHSSISKSEPEKTAVAKFLLNLTELNIYIGLQSVLDSLDIWLSAIKYVFDALNPSSGNRSAAEMYQWLHNPEGLLIFILGGVFIAFFAFCGNYVDTKRKGDKPWLIQEFSKLADATWPYIRDSFKGLKWTFKGTRSFLLVAQLISAQNMVYLITPLGVALGVIAALNRGWSRGMVERRKIVQSNNDAFREHVKYLNAAFMVLDSKWKDNFEHLSDDFKRIYQGGLIKIGDSLYYVDENLSLQSPKISPNFIQQFSKMDVFHYKKYLENNPNAAELAKILKLKENYLTQLSNLESSTAKKFYNFPKYQVDGKKAYASALLSGLLNAPYYFLGVLSLFLDVIPATIFPYAVAICGLFMVLNVVAELYQEFDYQRRLSISQNKAKLSMIKRLISHEWDKVNELLDGQFISVEGKNAQAFEHIFKKALQRLNLNSSYLQQFKKTTYSSSSVTPTDAQDFSVEKLAELKACLERLSKYNTDFNKYKNTLRKHLVLDRQATFMQGIKNGLHIYGVFNGCLMALSTMAFLAGFNLGIAFLYISIGCGIAFVTLSTIFTMLLTKNVKPEGSKTPTSLTPSSSEANLTAEPKGNVVFWAPAKEVNMLLDERDIQPSKNLMISEQCEVFRQFMSGSKKGVKLLQTILMLALGTSTDVELSEKVLYGVVALAYGGLFSLKGLRGLMRVDNQDYEQSTLVGRFFTKPETKKTLTPARSYHDFHSAFPAAATA